MEDPLKDEYSDIIDLSSDILHLDSGVPLRLTGVGEGNLQLLVAKMFFELTERRLIILVPEHKDFAHWTEFLANLEEEDNRNDTSILPSTVAWGSDFYVNRDLPKQQRLHCLTLLASKRCGVVVTTPSGLAQLTLPRSKQEEDKKIWKVGLELNLERISDELIELGYTPSNSVEEPGRFALRGGILDIFPPGREHPIRVEFFGDEIEKIREFSADTQRSLRDLEAEVWVGPAAEALTPKVKRDQIAQRLYDRWIAQGLEPYDRDGMLRSFREGRIFPALAMYHPVVREESDASIDYFNPKDFIICPKSLGKCLEKYISSWKEMNQAYLEDVELRRAVLSPEEHFISPAELEKKVKGFQILELNNPFEDGEFRRITFRSQPIPKLNPSNSSQSFDKWCQAFLQYKTSLILCQSKDQIVRLKSLLEHRDIYLEQVEKPLKSVLGRNLRKKGVFAGVGEIATLTRSSEDGVLIVPEQFIFGRKQIKTKSSSQRLKNYLSSFKELKIGGLVVHIDHGIGRYCGLTNLKVGGNHGDYLILEYAGGDKVYLPVEKLNLLQRYNPGTDSEAGAPLDRLSSQNWQKRKSKVRKAVRDMADQLLKLQAKRALSKGIPYGHLSDDYYKFEADFPYTETDDQQRAIAEVNSDMTSERPMDRLICGDVGFGKTEIAMRAAFRAVLDGFQVLVLVPTTVLCYQHFRTFRARMEKYGVVVAQANRFVKGVDLKSAKEGLASGRVDILIGTHRLLSKDIKVKRLGLLIIDEEQRFGVTHKEKLKELRAACDVLTLTATPIPRTLHMSMLGLRDISIVATPPQNRLAVKTFVAEHDDALIARAIMQEVNRGGQVFYLHNQVDDIVEKQNYLRKLCPGVEIKHAHGQMSEQRLEQVIVDFIEQKFSVLVCTTIIESGIDMPNVNTLIVDRADRFGLAQLYQIRGRVGRSTRQAFAYFLTPQRKMISEDAMKRLDVLTSYQELGSGFHIASHDLEIRGAGNLLGAEQSGKVGEVGLELYTDMLGEVIKELRGQAIEERIEPEIKVPFNAIIPVEYIGEENLRLELYKRIFSANDRRALVDLMHETADRFGKPPKETELLFKVAELKHLLTVCRITQLSVNRLGAAECRFASLSEAQIDILLGAARQKPRIYALAPDYKLQVFLNERASGPIDSQINWLMEFLGLLEPLALGFEGLA